jgi:hypothetical protein
VRKLGRVTFIEAHMIEIKLIGKFKVCLTINLEEYCTAWKVYKEAKSAATEEGKEKASLTAYKAIRGGLIEKLHGIAGESYWYTIRQIFADQCELSDAKEAELHRVLKRASPGLAEVPLAIEVFNTHFIEFLKNSMDAVLLNHYLKSDKKTTLEMTIEIKLEGDTVQLIVTDNGGGFSEDYLTEFKDHLKTMDERRVHSEKKEHDLYCFGGNRRGMRNIIAHFIHGCMTRGRSELDAIYYIPEGSTVMKLSNYTDVRGADVHGAKLEFISPLRPFPLLPPPPAAGAGSIVAVGVTSPPAAGAGSIAAVGITPPPGASPPLLPGAGAAVPRLSLPPSRVPVEAMVSGPSTSRGDGDSDSDEDMETGGRSAGLVSSWSTGIFRAHSSTLLSLLKRAQSAPPRVENVSQKRRTPHGGHSVDEGVSSPPDLGERYVRIKR